MENQNSILQGNKLSWVTTPITHSGRNVINQMNLELLLQINIKQGNSLHAIAEER